MGNVQGTVADNHSKIQSTTKLSQNVRLKSRALARFLLSAHRRNDGGSSVGDDSSIGSRSLNNGIDGNEMDRDVDDVDGDFSNVLQNKALDNDTMDEIIDRRSSVQLLNENVKCVDDIVHMGNGSTNGYVQNIVSGK